MIIREDVCIAQEGTEETEEKDETGDEVDYPPDDGGKVVIVERPMRNEINLKFTIPKGKVSEIMRVMSLLQLNFASLQIELQATGGQMSDQITKIKSKRPLLN